MRSMEPHVKAVLEHFETCDLREGDFIFTMVAAHLREILGAIKSSKSPTEAECHFKISACTLWNEVQKRSKCAIKFDVFTNKQSKTVDSFASQIIVACIVTGEDLLKCGVDMTEYASMVLQLTEENADFLQPFLTDRNLFDTLKKISRNCLTIPKELISKLREKSQKVFLSKTEHCQNFFIDRLVSVLHSLSRVMLYDDDTFSENKRENILWTADLVKALCVECKTVTGVSLLFMKLNPAVQRNIRLKQLTTLGESQKKTVLQELLVTAELNLKQPPTDTEIVYENGLMKSFLKTSFDDIEDLRFYLRICTKLWKLCSAEERESFREAAEEYCNLLDTKATALFGSWNRSINCVVHCGKFLAAKGEYEQAVKLFSKVLLVMNKNGDSKTYFWVCYNYARSVYCGNLKEHEKQAIRFCDEILKCGACEKGRLIERMKKQLSLFRASS